MDTLGLDVAVGAAERPGTRFFYSDKKAYGILDEGRLERISPLLDPVIDHLAFGVAHLEPS
jgi:hypothetical protein